MTHEGLSGTPHLWAGLPSWVREADAIFQEEVGTPTGLRVLGVGDLSVPSMVDLALQGADVAILGCTDPVVDHWQVWCGRHGLQVRFLDGSAFAVPCSPDFFDVIWAVGLPQNKDELEQDQLIAALMRVLRSGGRLILCHLTEATLLRKVEQAYQRALQLDSPLDEYSPLPVRAAMVRQGFGSVRELAIVRDGVYPTLEAIQGGVLAKQLRFLSHTGRLDGGDDSAHIVIGQKPPTDVAGPYALPASPMSGEVVVLSSCDWTYLWQRSQQLASEFAALGNRTVFVNGTIKTTRGALDDNIENLLAQAIMLNTTWANNVAVTSAFTSLVIGDTSIDTTETWIKVLLRSFGLRRPIFWVISYEWGLYADTLRQYGYVVFDCVDELSGFSWATDRLRLGEEMLLTHADMVSVTATALLDNKRNNHQLVHLIPNGVNPRQFRRVAYHRPTHNGVVVGFLGALADWVDTELVADLAEAHPTWTFILAGSHEGADLGRLRNATNVLLPGRVNYTEVPDVLAQFDVGIVPFKVNNLTNHANPIKVYEYLASGLPVVTTPFSEAGFFADQVSIAEGTVGFSRAIEHALTTCTPKHVAERLAYAETHSWRRKALTGVALAQAYQAQGMGAQTKAEQILMYALSSVAGSPDLVQEILVALARVGAGHRVIAELGEDPNRTGQFIQYLVDRQSFDAALGLADAMVDRFRNSCDALYNRGILLLGMGHAHRALNDFLALLEAHDDRAAIPLISETLRTMGESRRAARWEDCAATSQDQAEMRAFVDGLRQWVTQSTRSAQRGGNVDYTG